MTSATLDAQTQPTEEQVMPDGLAVMRTKAGKEIREPEMRNHMGLLKENVWELIRARDQVTIFLSLNGALLEGFDVLDGAPEDILKKVNIIYTDGKGKDMKFSSDNIVGQAIMIDDIVDKQETVATIAERIKNSDPTGKLITFVPVVKDRTLAELEKARKLEVGMVASMMESGEEFPDFFYAEEIEDSWIVSGYGMHGDRHDISEETLAPMDEHERVEYKVQRAVYDCLERLASLCMKQPPGWEPKDPKAYMEFLMKNSLIENVMKSRIFAALLELTMEDMQGRNVDRKFDIARQFFAPILQVATS